MSRIITQGSCMNRYFEDEVTLFLNSKIPPSCFIYFRSTNSVATHRNIPAAAGSSKAAGLTNGTNGVSSSDEDMEINWKDSIKSISILLLPEKDSSWLVLDQVYSSPILFIEKNLSRETPWFLLFSPIKNIPEF